MIDQRKLPVAPERPDAGTIADEPGQRDATERGTGGVAEHDLGALAFHAGFVGGYIFYDLSHYYIHHGHPRMEWLKKLRKHHMVHHSPNLENEKKFGVSSTLWDHVFGTYTEKS